MHVSRRDFLHSAVTGAMWFGATAIRSAAGETVPSPSPTAAHGRKTNLVVVLTDNQGAWTLGCYGNPDIRTPHIDSLARQGVRFTRAFSVNAVCSPTRATFLTGLLPSQHGVHCWLAGGGAQVGPKAYNTIREFRTLPKALAASGYTCGLVGKWHLGANLTPQEGFSYWITKPAGHTARFYNAQVIEDGTIRKEPGYITDLWTRHAVRFIERNRSRPFFLFLTYNGPYGLGASLLRPARNRHAATYAGKPMTSFPRLPVHPWQFHNKQYINKVGPMRRYAAECSGVDDGVGKVMAALNRLGLQRDTLVVYTADQGWGGGQHGLWGMGDHTRPLHAFDETMHIPLIVRQPGRVPAGKTCARLIAQYDLMGTLLRFLGVSKGAGKVEGNQPVSPGRDFTPALRGRPLANWDDTVFYEFEDTRVIRTAGWKYIHRHPSGPNELYDLTEDPGESKNLIDSPKHATRRAELKKRLDAFFTQYADPKYDLWRGGRSKAHRILRKRRPRPSTRSS